MLGSPVPYAVATRASNTQEEIRESDAVLLPTFSIASTMGVGQGLRANPVA